MPYLTDSSPPLQDAEDENDMGCLFFCFLLGVFVFGMMGWFWLSLACLISIISMIAYVLDRDGYLNGR